MSSGDRFEDLGDGRRSAAERLAEYDAADLEEERRSPPRAPRPSGRYSWLVGIAFLIAVIVAGSNALRHSGASLRGPHAGTRIPDFAAPEVNGPNADVNLKQRTGSGGAPNKTRACDVHDPHVVNVCELEARKPLVLVFITTRGAKCAPGLDAVERVYREAPQVAFVGIVGDDRSAAAQLVRQHDWTFPVAYDRDGALFNRYLIAVCPTTVFAYRGGRVRTTVIGKMSDAELRAQARRLVP